MGAEEFINGKKRYCLWLKKAEPADIKSSKELYRRVQDVFEFRSKSSAKTARGYAKVPHLFAQITQPDDVPYMIIPEASIYHFGILTSNVHMAWMRTVCGRLKSDYRHSKEIVYNTFPWPSPTNEQKASIEQTAQAILDARAKYPSSSLADLYDEVTMPSDLRKAHQDNDRAVMAAFGMDVKTTTESSCVVFPNYSD